MIDNILHISKNAAVYGMGRAAGGVLILLALPVLTAYLAPDEFGVVALLAVLGFVTESLFGLGIGPTVGVVYFASEDRTHRDATIWSALVLFCLSGLALLVLVGGASALISELLLGHGKWQKLVVLQLFIVAARLAVMPLLLKLQFDSRPLGYVCVSAVSIAFGVTVALLLVARFEMGVYGWMIGHLCGAILSLALGLLFALPFPVRVDPDLMRRILKLGYPLIPGAFFVLLILNSAPFFLKHLADLSETGIYSVGYQLGMGITLATAAITTAWYPFFQFYTTRHDAGSEVFPRLATTYLMIFGFLTLLFFILARPMVYILMDESFYNAYQTVGPIAAGQFLIGFWVFLLPGIYFSAETKWMTLLQAPAAIITVIGHITLIPLLKAEGAALAIVIGTLSLIIMQIALNRWRAYQVKMFEPGRAAGIFLMIILTCGAQRFIDERVDSWFAVIASSLLILTYMAASWLILTRSERNKIYGWITYTLKKYHVISGLGMAAQTKANPEISTDEAYALSKTNTGSLSILFLINDTARNISTVNEHILSLVIYSKYNIYTFDSSILPCKNLDISKFDIIVFHYSIIFSHENYISTNLAKKLADFKGLKIAFLQDEYRWVDRAANAIRRLGISVIFTVLNKEAISKVYHHPWLRGIRFEQTLTGFVPEHLLGRSFPSYQERVTDVAYRARKLSGLFGEFAQEKWSIGQRFARDAPQYDLRCDIAFAEVDRIYGEDWIRFLSSSKAVLGTESGASVVDFTDKLRKEVESFEFENPDVPFEEIQRRFLQNMDGDIVVHVISPRCFEAAAMRTLMVMYPGEYSGILEEGRHYVPLEKDHSNMAEVVTIIKDPEKAGEIIENAYQEIACSGRWTFEAMVAHFDSVVDDEMSKKPFIARGMEYCPISEAEVALWRRKIHHISLIRSAKRSATPFLQKLKSVVLRVIMVLPAPVDRIMLALLRRPAFWIEKRIKKWLLGDG